MTLVFETTKPVYYLAESKTTIQPLWAKINMTQKAVGPLPPDHSHTKSSHNSGPTFELEFRIFLILTTVRES